MERRVRKYLRGQAIYGSMACPILFTVSEEPPGKIRFDIVSSRSWRYTVCISLA
jgi:hypothetical protein